MVVVGSLVAMLLVVGCGSPGAGPMASPTINAADLTPTPQAMDTSTPVPTATPLPATPTPEPTATAIPAPLGVSFSELGCIDFHPGVFNPDEPPHWYEVSGTFERTPEAVGEVVVDINIEIIDSEGAVLAESPGPVLPMRPGRPVVFIHRIDLEPQAHDFTCRVTYSVQGDASGRIGVATAAVEPLYAP